MKDFCASCGSDIGYKKPSITVDCVIYTENKEIILIERKNAPFGFALAGGFVDYNETCECAVIREMQEEVGLNITIEGVLGVYSDPKRDLRGHTISIVYYAKYPVGQKIQAGDDAKNAALYSIENLPTLVFDHEEIVKDFRKILNIQLC